METFFNTSNLSQHKSKWTPEEDKKLLEAVALLGTDSWIRVSQRVPGRNSKQCCERWMGQLSPDIIKANWTPEEDEILLKQHALIGNKWTLIATMLPGRSAINVKNRWSRLKRHHSINHFNIYNLGYPQKDDEVNRIDDKLTDRITHDCMRPKQEEMRDSDSEIVVVHNHSLLEFPRIDASLFGEDFLKFQARMLE
ncbi:Myb-like DNA-binding domain containing protein [Tritrichomonas foetus]|uniref:Myb-like DNA-binding domain containing protein n=1 Tax=Tritrichomonas foetus TaxID=1144522 RepID=A0A1J4KCE3_9EUKA|nr:Myb-like DNA-binding domain containing protein [Tritrichomonas foetus]|eukprot:OHT09097.1 Myb-like DNA-binding domain containing protein [Tritrichomonas foetus]